MVDRTASMVFLVQLSTPKVRIRAVCVSRPARVGSHGLEEANVEDAVTVLAARGRRC